MTAQPVGIGYAPEWTLGDRLRKARKQTGMTQKAFAELIGEEPSRYSQWEADNNRPRHLVDVAQNIEDRTGVSAAWLLGLVPSPGANGSAFRMDERRPVGRVPVARFQLRAA
jgi:transcriptional regulator with XRE-family HTH domain